MEAGMVYNLVTAHDLSFASYFKECDKHGFGCTLYRLPQTDTKHLLIDLNGGQTIDKVQIENIGSGFVFHPFSSEQHPIKFLKQDIHLIQNEKNPEIQVLKSILTEDELLTTFGQVKSVDTPLATTVKYQPELTEITEKEQYLNLIRKTIGEINNGRFQKAVISRRKVIGLPAHFDAVAFFNALCSKYTNAFVHLTYIPDAGMWIGATPEMLIEIDKENIFQTVALAATQACSNDVDVEETTWSQKDIEEQALVSRYIINCFKKIRLREFEEIGPRTYLSGNLVHLKTSFQVNINQVAFPELGTVMLDLLHPTSAVCGMPREITQSFIHNNEGFDRTYFTGYLGPVNLLNETNIFVNLRTMNVMGDHAHLFAGAGIIANSNPEKEWYETEIKMDTLLSVLKEL